MIDQGLLEAFNDCIERINAGQSMSDCLRLYPQYAASLRPMLELGRLVERAQVSPFEVATAQSRVRARMIERLQTPPRARPAYASLALLAASFLITFAAVFGMAEGSLPGDALYGFKRLTEGARTIIMGDQFAARRLDEVRVLLALRRAAPVTFSGIIERIDGEQWLVASLPLRVQFGTPGTESLAVGDRVSVDADTTEQGDLFARAFTLLEKADVLPTPTIPPAFTITPLPTQTAVPPTSTPSPTPTHTATQLATPTATTMLALTATLAVCVPAQPAGWVVYRVQPNDTVAGLANITGASVAQLLAVNCLSPTLMIIVGDSLFLPSLPPLASAPAQQPTQGVDHGGSSNSGSGSSSDDDDDNSGPGGGGDDSDDD